MHSGTRNAEPAGLRGQLRNVQANLLVFDVQIEVSVEFLRIEGLLNLTAHDVCPRDLLGAFRRRDRSEGTNSHDSPFDHDPSTFEGQCQRHTDDLGGNVVPAFQLHAGTDDDRQLPSADLKADRIDVVEDNGLDFRSFFRFGGGLGRLGPFNRLTSKFLDPAAEVVLQFFLAHRLAGESHAVGPVVQQAFVDVDDGAIKRYGDLGEWGIAGDLARFHDAPRMVTSMSDELY